MFAKTTTITVLVELTSSTNCMPVASRPLLCRVTLGKSLNSFGFCLIGNWSCEQRLLLPSWARRAPVTYYELTPLCQPLRWRSHPP